MIGRKRITSRLAMCKKKNMDLEVKTRIAFQYGHKGKIYNVQDDIIFSGARRDSGSGEPQ